MSTYYVRSDGTAANKEAATGPTSNAALCMNEAIYNSETFSPGDIIYISGLGGDYTTTLDNNSSGSAGNIIQYIAEDDPTFATGDKSLLIDGTVAYVSYDGFIFTGEAADDGAVVVEGINSYIYFTDCDIDGNDVPRYGFKIAPLSTNTIHHIYITNGTVTNVDRVGIYLSLWPDTDEDLLHSVWIDGVTVTGCGTEDYGAAILISGQAATDLNISNVHILNCSVHDNPGWGIYYQFCDDVYGRNIVSGCEVYENCSTATNGGIWFGTVVGITVENNTVYDNHTTGIDGRGIYFDIGTDDFICRYNKVYGHVDKPELDSISAGIGVTGATNGEIYYNLVYDNACGISFSGDATEDIVVYNNNIVNNNIGDGIAVSLTSTLVNTDTIIFKNNILYGSKYGFYNTDSTEPIISYNCYNGNTSADLYGIASKGTGEVSSDPVFIDPDNDNYRLDDSSPCRDAGDNSIVSGIVSVTDFDGRDITSENGFVIAYGDVVDIGAFEYEVVEALSSIGALFMRGNGEIPETFYTVAEVKNISGPGMERDVIDVTHLTSPGGYREFVGGLCNGGEVTIGMNFRLDTYDDLDDDFEYENAWNYKIRLDDDLQTEFVFSAYVINLGVGVQMNEAVKADATFKLSGEMEVEQ